MESYKRLRARLLKKKEFRKAYNELKPEFVLVRMVIEKRIEQGLTQAALARKMGTKQSAIARLESGAANPTVSFLKKLAKALGAELAVGIS